MTAARTPIERIRADRRRSTHRTVVALILNIPSSVRRRWFVARAGAGAGRTSGTPSLPDGGRSGAPPVAAGSLRRREEPQGQLAAQLVLGGLAPRRRRLGPDDRQEA